MTPEVIAANKICDALEKCIRRVHAQHGIADVVVTIPREARESTATIIAQAMNDEHVKRVNIPALTLTTTERN